MTKEQYWFWLCSSPDIYREDVNRILEVMKTPENVFYSDKNELLEKQLVSLKQKNGLEKSAGSQSFLEAYEKLKTEGIRFICPESEDYPERLKGIPDRPVSLYVKGALPDPEKPTAGMVGARACSEYGRAMAKKFAKALAGAGVQVVSGMAAGIDAISAKGALSGGGKTFAVLGCGVDVIYPIENFGLYYEILSSGGGIISEYPLGTQPIPWQFPARNRIISGLSDRLLVMEAKKRSGTLITVQYALAQGRDVYALPGRVTDKTSEGCNQMIADGAGILLTPGQLIAEIYQTEPKEEEKRPEPTLEKVVRQVYDLMSAEPVSIDFIIEKTNISAEKTAAILTELELSGLIREVSKNQFVKIF